MSPQTSIKSSLITRSLPGRISLVISGLLIITLLNPAPSHAWWFLSKPPAQDAQATVQPKQSTGLVLSPILQAIIPQFILEPLQKQQVEETPAISQPRPSLVLQPIQQPTPTAFSPVAQRMLELVNKARQQQQLPQLTLNQHLMTSAQDYADAMAQQNFFSHTSPSGTSLKERNEDAGYTNWQWMGENLGRGQDTVDEVVEDWLRSEGHRKNILNKQAKELGVGMAKKGNTTYWVQEFGLQFE